MLFMLEKNKIILQYEPVFNYQKINKAMCNYMKSNGWITEFKEAKKFEEKIADFLKVKHCIMTNNGTISLSLALLANGIKAGDNVLVPSLTMIATANAVKLIGANPIFCDVEPETLCMNLKEAEILIKLWDIKAIIYVSLNGRRAKIESFIKKWEKNGIKFIEDNAQALGSKTLDGKYIGNTEHISSFSFSMPKIITIGQGGCLTTNNDYLANRLRKLKDFGRDGGGNDIHNYFGINSKITDLQAIVGLEQLKDIYWRRWKKMWLYGVYYSHLKEIKEIEFIPTNLEFTVPWFVDIYTNKREELIKYLEKHNIKTRKIYPPIYNQKCYDLDLKSENPITEKYANRGLWLPCSFSLTNEDIFYVCDKIKKFFKEK